MGQRQGRVPRDLVLVAHATAKCFMKVGMHRSRRLAGAGRCQLRWLGSLSDRIRPLSVSIGARTWRYNPPHQRDVVTLASGTSLLIVIAGPARGRSVPLEQSVSIGRGEQNALVIPDPALSRQHCVIDTGPEGVSVRDLGSRNGVFVNACPVSERRLAAGDQIRIGDSALLVMIPHGEPSSPRLPVSLVDTPILSTSTIAVNVDASHYLRGTATKPASGRAAEDLALLLRISEALQHVATTHALYDLLLTHALESFRADTAAIVGLAPGDDSLTVVAARTQDGRPDTINRTLAVRAIAERRAMLQDSTAMCVPLVGPDTVTSGLCVAGATDARFSNENLQVMAAIGSIGGLALERVRHLEWVTAENTRLRQDASIEHNLVGESAAMRAVHRFIARVAATDASVLLYGESGTGKELVATAIHGNSARSNGPLIPINCAALPDALLESELFGHERGAFTGAVSQQCGRFELADRGTIFLDEIGELALPLQAKLLRVLQDQIVERVGARRAVKVDVRIVAATNRDLREAIKQGRFREDLYYRLNVVSLTVPPLRDRRDDVPLLACLFRSQARRALQADGQGRLTGRATAAAGLRLARQRARAVQRARTGRRARVERRDSARGPS